MRWRDQAIFNGRQRRNFSFIIDSFSFHHHILILFPTFLFSRYRFGGRTGATRAGQRPLLVLTIGISIRFISIAHDELIRYVVVTSILFPYDAPFAATHHRPSHPTFEIVFNFFLNIFYLTFYSRILSIYIFKSNYQYYVRVILVCCQIISLTSFIISSHYFQNEINNSFNSWLCMARNLQTIVV